MISYTDLRKSLFDEETTAVMEFLIAGDLMKKRFTKISDLENADNALKMMETFDLEFLPVYNTDDKFIGVVSKQKILRVYQNELFLAEKNLNKCLILPEFYEKIKIRSAFSKSKAVFSGRC